MRLAIGVRANPCAFESGARDRLRILKIARAKLAFSQPGGKKYLEGNVTDPHDLFAGCAQGWQSRFDVPRPQFGYRQKAACIGPAGRVGRQIESTRAYRRCFVEAPRGAHAQPFRNMA